MKRIIAAVLCLLLAAGLYACTPAPTTEPTEPAITTPTLREEGTPVFNGRGEQETDSNGEPVNEGETDANSESVNNGEDGSEAASLPQTAYVLAVSESLVEDGNRRKPSGIQEYCELKLQENYSLSFSLGIPLEFSIIKVSQDSVEIALLGDAELEVSGRVGENNDPKQFVLKQGESVEVQLKDLDTTGIYTFTIVQNPQGN